MKEEFLRQALFQQSPFWPFNEPHNTNKKSEMLLHIYRWKGTLLCINKTHELENEREVPVTSLFQQSPFSTP